jgi:heat shock protein HslJ
MLLPRTAGIVITLVLLAACAGDRPQPQATEADTADMHNSRNSLDWSGAYEGILACEGCAGTWTRLTLGQDGSFELSRRSLVRGATPETAKGQFSWQPDGNTIVLDASGGGRGFAVGEGRVIALNSDGSRPDAAGASLLQLAPGGPGARTGLAEVLEDHRWTLTSTTDADNQPVASLFPSADRPFVFTFAGSRLMVEGGCNGLRGGYQLGADGLLTTGPMISTQMACDAPLMAADKALSALLAAPVEVALVSGPEPTLAMLAASGEALLLTGRMTPEAKYGPATTLFLEVGPERLPCDNAPTGDGLCLQVREIAFNDRGLREGTPGEFTAFPATIEGYTHQAGTRNVLRVKRFQPGGARADPGAGVFVLDLTVESQTMSP